MIKIRSKFHVPRRNVAILPTN